MQDAGRRMLDVGRRTQYSFGIRSLGFEDRESGSGLRSGVGGGEASPLGNLDLLVCRTHDGGFRMQDTGRRTWDAGRRTEDA